MSSGSKSSPTTPRHFHVVFVDSDSIITLFEKLCASEMKAFDEERYTPGKRGSPAAIELKESFAQISEAYFQSSYDQQSTVLQSWSWTRKKRRSHGVADAFFVMRNPEQPRRCPLNIDVYNCSFSTLVIRHHLARSFSDSDKPGYTALPD